MKVASLNLNKKLGSDLRRTQLATWLAANSVDVFVAQEPCKHDVDAFPLLPGFVDIGGSSMVHAWVADGFGEPPVVAEVLDPGWCLRVDIPDLVLYVVCLSPRQQTERATQLNVLRAEMLAGDRSPTLVIGDFNMGPRDADGRLGAAASTWNSETDRNPFRRLITDVLLVDLGAPPAPHAFTFSKPLPDRRISAFRRDLALASEELVPRLGFAYDHSTREGEDRLTDHSAVLVEVGED